MKGRLMQLLTSRGGAVTAETGHGEPTMVLQHREALVYTLGKAAALEQLVMCQYLYAAFSMKDREDDGLAPDQLAAVKRWRREIIHIAEQEMLHLALVQNLLTAVGASSSRSFIENAAYRYWHITSCSRAAALPSV